MLFYTFLSVLLRGGSLYSTLTLCSVIPKDSLLILLLCLFCLHESMSVSMSGTCGIKCNHNAIHSPRTRAGRGLRVLLYNKGADRAHQGVHPVSY